MALARTGAGQRRVRVVRATAVRDPGGDAVGVGCVRVLPFAIAGVVRRVSGKRTRPYLTGSLHTHMNKKPLLSSCMICKRVNVIEDVPQDGKKSL